MKVIKKLRAYQTSCPHCKSILEIANDDIKEEEWKTPGNYVMMDGTRKYYICPVCGHKPSLYSEESELELLYEDTCEDATEEENAGLNLLENAEKLGVSVNHYTVNSKEKEPLDETNPFTFRLSDKLYRWIREHEKTCHSRATAGEHFEISFIPTGIVECQEVKCLVCGEKEIDYVD